MKTKELFKGGRMSQITFDNIESNISKDELEKKQEKRDCKRLIYEMSAIGLHPSKKSREKLENDKNLCLVVRQMLINDCPDSYGCENPHSRWIVSTDDEESMGKVELYTKVFRDKVMFTTKKNYELAQEIFANDIDYGELYSTIGEHIFRKMKRI